MKPFDAGVVANLDVRDERAAGDDDARALVSAYQWHFGLQGPVALDGVQVRVADAAVFDVDQDLIGTWLRHGDLLVDNLCNKGVRFGQLTIAHSFSLISLLFSPLRRERGGERVAKPRDMAVVDWLLTAACLLEDLSPLLLGNVWCSHGRSFPEIRIDILGLNLVLFVVVCM